MISSNHFIQSKEIKNMQSSTVLRNSHFNKCASSRCSLPASPRSIHFVYLSCGNISWAAQVLGWFGVIDWLPGLLPLSDWLNGFFVLFYWFFLLLFKMGNILCDLIIDRFKSKLGVGHEHVCALGFEEGRSLIELVLEFLVVMGIPLYWRFSFCIFGEIIF